MRWATSRDGGTNEASTWYPVHNLESSNASRGVKVIAAPDSDMLAAPMTQHGALAPPRPPRPRRPPEPDAARGPRFAVACALGLLAALARPASARAEAFEVSDTSWEGCSELLEIARAELGAARVMPVGVLDWSDVQPEDGVLVLHPLHAMDADETTSFMKAGGRLAIADDYGLGDETLRRFHIDRISAPLRPVTALRNRPELAIAEPAVDVIAGRPGAPHPVVAHVQQLVTNHPTGLRHPNLSPVLRIRAIGEPDVIIAVAGQVGKGRLFAMSDPSAGINEMLRYPGNRAFVAGLARYLVDDDGAMHRQGRLFIVANRFGEQGSFGGAAGFRKDLDAQLKAIANALADVRRDGFPGWAHIAFAAALAFGLGIWVARASAKPYRGPLPRYARPTPLVAQGGVAGRFAMLAAPTSPRNLALLELKSALSDALAFKLDLPGEPSPDVLAKAARRAGSLDDRAYSSLKEVLALMHQVEASVVAGKPAPVSRSALFRAARVVRSVLDACGAGAFAGAGAPALLASPPSEIKENLPEGDSIG
jgi:hypothetical protein